MCAARKNLLSNRDCILFYRDGKEVIPGVQAMHACRIYHPGPRSCGRVGLVIRLLSIRLRLCSALLSDPPHGDALALQ
jgi:hypothetical protein